MSFEYVKNIMVSGDGNPYPGGAAAYESQLRSDPRHCQEHRNRQDGDVVFLPAIAPGLDRAA